jgi:hypothetical protein
MDVLLLAADPDLRHLLGFAVRYRGLSVQTGTLEDLPLRADLVPAVMVVQMSEATSPAAIDAVRAHFQPHTRVIVLSPPGRAVQRARRLLPESAATLTLPVAPAQLVRCVHEQLAYALECNALVGR